MGSTLGSGLLLSKEKMEQRDKVHFLNWISVRFYETGAVYAENTYEYVYIH